MHACTDEGWAHWRVSITLRLGKTLTNVSCAPDRIWTAGHGIHWILRPTLYQLSHHVICNVCASGAVKMQCLCGSVFYAPYINFHSFIHILTGDLDLHLYRQFKIKTKMYIPYQKVRKVENDIRTNLFKHLQQISIKIPFSDINQIRTKKEKYAPATGANAKQTTTTTKSEAVLFVCFIA